MRSDPIHPAELGGTLFVPATHPKLHAVASGEKYPALRSMVIDLEDGIDTQSRQAALNALASLLPQLPLTSMLRFLRPSSPGELETLLGMTGIEAVDGFVLPKFGLDNARQWLQPLEKTAFAFMPSIEGKELFDRHELMKLAALLVPFRERIPVVRFGLEDMLRQLGMARDCDTPLYGLVAPAQVIGNFITVFKPRGFGVSGGVYKCYENSDGFRKEVEADLRQGLLGKTIIHPSQIGIVEEMYKANRDELAQAENIVNAASNVSGFHGIMLERPTQLPWAQTILKRAALYGVRS